MLFPERISTAPCIAAAELFDDPPEVIRQNGLDLVQDIRLERTITGFGNGAGDTGQGVAVAPQGNGIADGVLVTVGLQT